MFALIRKNSKFDFGGEHLNSFNEIKSKLVKAPILSVYSPKLETEVHCDASSAGYGAILNNRWALILQNYDYELIHREGNKMRHVDALSRVYSIMVLDENSFELNLAIAQNLDPDINKFINY